MEKNFRYDIQLSITFETIEVNWGQTTDAQLLKTAISTAYKLNLKSDHVKCYRPSILLLSGVSPNRMPLILLANEITRHRGMLIVGDVVSNEITFDQRLKTIEFWNKWLKAEGIKSFYTLVKAATIGFGSDILMQVCIHSLSQNFQKNLLKKNC